MHDVKNIFWDDPYSYRSCADGLIRRFVLEYGMLSVLEAHNSSLVGGYHNCIRTAQKIMNCGYYWPTINQYAHALIKACD